MGAPAGIELLSEGSWNPGSVSGEWSPGGCGCGSGSCSCGGSCGCKGEGGGSCGGGKPSGEVPLLADYAGEIWAERRPQNGRRGLRSMGRGEVGATDGSETLPSPSIMMRAIADWNRGISGEGATAGAGEHPHTGGEIPVTTTTATTTTTTGGGGEWTCTPVAVGQPPQCCVTVYCAMLPVYVGGGNVHCWLEVTNCDGSTDRFEVWQSEADIAASGGTRLGGKNSNVVKNFKPPGEGVGGGDGEVQCGPFCTDCDPIYEESPFEGQEWADGFCPEIIGWSGCECVGNSAGEYSDKHSEAYMFVFGKNSNTFAQTVIDECGIECNLPPSAVGADNTYLPSVSGRGCKVRAQIGMGTGVTVGLTQVTAEIGGMPVGISTEGVHCLITIEWPWNWF